MFWNSRTPGVTRCNHPWQKLVLILTAFALLARVSAAPAAETDKKGTNKNPKASFISAGKAIEVERFEPKAPGTYPVLILLYGSDGLEKCGFYYRSAAQMVAQEGYVVLLVHYFDRTGIKAIAPDQIKKEQFLDWMGTVRDAHGYAARQPGVDKNRIGLVGLSLGACLALAVAAEDKLPIAAVVDWFGKLPAELRKECKNLPPTLIIHGDADRTVPVAEARALESLLKDKKLSYEIKVYEKQEHLFLNDPFGKDACDARKRTIAFLAKHFKSEMIAAAGKDGRQQRSLGAVGSTEK